MNETQVVELALDEFHRFLEAPRFEVKRSAALLYQLTLDNNLKVTPDMNRPPRRGQSAFETDLCVFERVRDVLLPRVVFEFKVGLSTHDILTYSARAGRHKQIYPYLRYGLIVAAESTIPSKFFIHNQSIDFFLAAAERISSNTFGAALRSLTTAEIEASQLLEVAAFERRKWQLYRTAIVVEPGERSAGSPQ